MEAQGRRCYVRTTLGVDDRAWNRLHHRVREWRRHLELQCGIPGDAELRPSDLPTTAMTAANSCACACHDKRLPSHSAGMVTHGLGVAEDFAVETGGVQAVNVCLDMDEAPAYRNVSLDRLFNRINATAAQERNHALTIFGQDFGQEPEDMVVRSYERLRNYNPVPVHTGTCGDGWYTRNLPIDRIIGGPVFRNPDADCLLQVAGLVAQALLWREEPGACADSGERSGLFAVLDRALNRRASRNETQGLVRR